MDEFVKENLEAYLEGGLSGRDLERFEARLVEDPAALEVVEAFQRSSQLFAAFRLDEPMSPSPGFYARVDQAIQAEKTTPFSMVFFQPFMLRRLVFASLMWLFALGTISVLTDDSTRHSHDLAEMVLHEQPETEQYLNVRLGPNLEQNRDSMLSVVMASAELGD